MLLLNLPLRIYAYLIAGALTVVGGAYLGYSYEASKLNALQAHWSELAAEAATNAAKLAATQTQLTQDFEKNVAKPALDPTTASAVDRLLHHGHPALTSVPTTAASAPELTKHPTNTPTEPSPAAASEPAVTTGQTCLATDTVTDLIDTATLGLTTTLLWRQYYNQLQQTTTNPEHVTNTP